ncbi:MAG: hypothetical protein M5U27_10985 [Gaiella sp.]|nr:hypothetical protein [Gaiella sp.]
MRSSPADGAAEEADGELLAHLAVVVDRDVAGVGVDAQDPLHLHLDPRLLLDLAYDRLRDALAGLHRAARDRPVLVVGAPVEEDPSLVVDHDRRRGRNEAVRLRRVRVVEEVAAGAHGAVGGVGIGTDVAQMSSRWVR